MNYVSKTNNFNLTQFFCEYLVVTFKQLIGNQQGYLNLTHYLRHPYININHRLTKTNCDSFTGRLKRDGEKGNLLPVPCAITFMFLLSAKDSRLAFSCSPPQTANVGSAHHQHSHLL